MLALIFCIISFISSLNFVSSYTNEALQDQVTTLVGLNEPINFNQFSGYLNLGTTKKNIHYWFVESESTPSTDPLVFWTNGGPGCSGLIGFLTEQGPFRPDANGKLKMNEWRWNKIANMVFLEQPVGVGFSYSDDTSDYKIGDDQAAKDNLQTILEFLKKFPEFANSPLYITSESYGGHYMPTLAWEIIQYNENVESEGGQLLNFKGFAVGNPYTDYYSGVGAEMETYWGKQLLPKPSWDKYVATGCLEPANLLNNSVCSTLMLDFMKKIGNLNPYALDYPVCLSAQQVWLNEHMFSANKDFTTLHQGVPLKDEYEPCEDNYSADYLNREDVKNDLHVRTNIQWDECSRTVKYEYVDKMKPMEKYYNKILNSKSSPYLNILVYSGDDDGVCGTVGTQKWIYDLGFPVKSLWKTWEVDGQMAGYVTEFNTPFSSDSRFKFATVHFAGHEVPTYKPKEAFVLFQSYLNNDL
jgi:carboxypeptidase C (cathepsin A)